MLFRISAMHCLLAIFVAVGLFLSPEGFAQAQDFNDGFEKVEEVRVDSQITDFGGSLSVFVLAVLRVVVALVAVLALAALIYGAVMYITSLGDEGKTEKAKHIIMYAVIGLLVLGAAGIVVNAVINFIRQ